MAFQLKYEKNGETRRQQFSSYYECIKEKENLRRQGIEVVYTSSGPDAKKTNYGPIKLNASSKEAVRNFLKMCDGIGDFHNFKSV